MLRSATKKMMPLMCMLASTVSGANEADSGLFALELDDLLELTVTSGSNRAEQFRHTPASIQVITEQDIKQRGYTSFSEVIADLSGFDLNTSYGVDHSLFYQRGYRTPSNQRTLVMVNGVINNQLWGHDFSANRQTPLTMIERIEVLSGPAGAVYGPNAFLGVINIITKKGKALQQDGHKVSAQAQLADFGSKALDLNLLGKAGHWSYWLGIKQFKSDGPGVDDFARWDFVDEQYLSDPRFWGPVLNYGHDGVPYGQYVSKDDESGVFGEVSFDTLTLGVNNWITHNGYGLQFAFDRGQPNARWSRRTSSYYLRHETPLFDKGTLKHFIRYRSEQRYGDWAEASPDPLSAQSRNSYVTISDWNSTSSSSKVRQDYEYQYNSEVHLAAGLKYERKELTSAYEICGYFASAYCTFEDPADLGPYGLGKGVYYSTDPDMQVIRYQLKDMPDENLVTTTDKGVYFRASYKQADWSLSGAIRWDNNSVYGTFIKPRVALTYDINATNTVKAIYATAFQEPAPVQLYGGWNGRNANPELAPEEVKDLTLIWMNQSGAWFSDLSVYYSRYNNVIKEEANNAGERDVLGAEWRLRYEAENPWFDAPQISAYMNYTYTKTTSHINFDHQLGVWVGDDTPACEDDAGACGHYRVDLGDIAPHKLNLGLNLPLSTRLSINTRLNYVSEKSLYLRNPLREQGTKLGDYLVTNMSLVWQQDALSVHLKVKNLFDSQVYHAGSEQGSSGNQFRDEDGDLLRSQGFYNSIFPQVGRNWELGVTVVF
ncbi:TonB-dependent receptor plug domain-containing protein [Pseudoalteromonas viridis]|uniref:TonB-dependent receptor plug domain-containing protein n=1 Tax=Pseudoalteromonas viridis TaxID=339617 RepID=A0ABX7UZJ5_9GAMM|nr:TonB-dependent receptor [Pseudoalteromonas viridis]QTL34031.1 TonB-dependent receptor plug domain-containing protein [Pseudoalteromonas viridis]